MIGTIVGIISALGLLGSAFAGDQYWFAGFFGSIVVFSIIGLILFPRTVGIALTWIQLSSPIAAIGGGLLHGWGIFFASLGVLCSCWIVNLIIAFIRPEAR